MSEEWADRIASAAGALLTLLFLAAIGAGIGLLLWGDPWRGMAVFLLGALFQAQVRSSSRPR